MFACKSISNSGVLVIIELRWFEAVRNINPIGSMKVLHTFGTILHAKGCWFWLILIGQESTHLLVNIYGY